MWISVAKLSKRDVDISRYAFGSTFLKGGFRPVLAQHVSTTYLLGIPLLSVETKNNCLPYP
jgi:hypothetical protein